MLRVDRLRVLQPQNIKTKTQKVKMNAVDITFWNYFKIKVDIDKIYSGFLSYFGNFVVCLKRFQF